MGAYAAIPGRRAGQPLPVGVTRSTATPRAIGGVSAALGLVYGLYVGLVDRRGGELTAGNVWLGLLCGLLFAALFAGVWQALRGVTPGLRAVGFGVLTAVAMGFLASRGDGSVLGSAVLGLAVGAGIGIGTYYYCYSRSD